MGKRGPKLGSGGRPRSGKVDEAIAIYKSKSRQRVRNMSEFLHILSRVFVHIIDFPNINNTRISTDIRSSWDILLDNVNSKKRLQYMEEIMRFISEKVYALTEQCMYCDGQEWIPVSPDEITKIHEEWVIASKLFYQLKNPENFGEFKPLAFGDGLYYPLPLDQGEKHE